MNKRLAYRQYVAALIRKLPQDQRLVLSLYYCERLNFHEIGKVLGIEAAEAARLFVKGASSCVSTGRYPRLRLVIKDLK